MTSTIIKARLPKFTGFRKCDTVNCIRNCETNFVSGSCDGAEFLICEVQDLALIRVHREYLICEVNDSALIRIHREYLIFQV